MTSKPVEIALQVDRMREARERMGWSQRELGRQCGVGEVQINRYEKGQTDPSSTNLKLIAAALNVSTDYLLGLTDEPRGHLGDDLISGDEESLLHSFRREGWAGVAQLLVDQLRK